MFDQLIKKLDPEVSEPVKSVTTRKSVEHDVHVKRAKIHYKATYVPNPWNLSARQFACLELLASCDELDKVLADRLGIGVKTFSSHTGRARAAMGVKTTSAAIVKFDRWKFPRVVAQDVTIQLRLKDGCLDAVLIDQ